MINQLILHFLLYFLEVIQQFQQILPLTPENILEPHNDNNGFKIQLRHDKTTGLNFSRGQGILLYKLIKLWRLLIEWKMLNNLMNYVKKIFQEEILQFSKKRHRDENKLWVVGFLFDKHQNQLLKEKFELNQSQEVGYQKKKKEQLLNQVQGNISYLYDLKGNLPQKVVNFAASVQDQVIERLKIYGLKAWKKK